MRYIVNYNNNKNLFFNIIFLLFLIILPIILLVVSKDLDETDRLTVFEGSGTIEAPYLLQDADDICELYGLLQQGYTFEKMYFAFTDDISMRDKTISIHEEMVFCGTIDGCGYSLTDLNMKDADHDYCGFIPVLYGTVENVVISNSSFGGNCVGIVAGRANASSQIINCELEADLSGEINGSVVGSGQGIIENCVVKSAVPFVGKDITSILANDFYCMDSKYYDMNGDLCEEEEVVRLLNDNILYLHQYYNVCYWSQNSELSQIKCDSFNKACIEVSFDDSIKTVNGFYNRSDDKWYFVFPTQADDWNYKMKFYNEKDEYTYNGLILDNEYSFSYNDVTYDVKLVPYSDINTMCIETSSRDGLEYLYETKENNLLAYYKTFSTDGRKVAEGQFEAIRGRGNDSFNSYSRWKNGFALYSTDAVSLFDMPTACDYVLLPGYRVNSMISYIIEKEMYKEIGGRYAADYEMVNLYFNGEYMGAYMLTSPMEIDKNRYDLVNSEEITKAINVKKLYQYEKKNWGYKDGQTRVGYSIPESPKDITGGYILEIGQYDYLEEDSRFITPNNTHVCLKSNRYASTEQVDYIADYWEEFEEALFSDDGYNSAGKYYSDYLDLQSTADLMLSFEVTMDGSQWASIFFYKDSDSIDEKLYAGCHWDLEHSYKTDIKDIYSYCTSVDRGFELWNPLYSHADFRDVMRSEWSDTYRPALEILVGDRDASEGNGLVSLYEYEERYADISYLNGLRWEDSDWNSRIEEVDSYISTRMQRIDYFLENDL